MEGIDRVKIDAIILRESGNSLYMQQQRKRDEKVNRRIQQMKERLSSVSSSSSNKEYQVTPELDEQLEHYKRQSPTRSTCVVVDMDMFFMACELLTRPDLKDVPACVGRGMITTSNYVARRYGVRSAMAGFIGDKLVEELSGGTQKLHHVPSNFALYREKSHIVKDVLREYDPFNMKSYSLDEAFLDIGPYLVVYLQHPDWNHEQIRDTLLLKTSKGDDSNANNVNPSVSAMEFLQTVSSLTCMEAADKVVAQLRQRVTEATRGLTCSAGVAPNVSLAKIASDKNKPNGQLLVDPSRVLDFVHPLPIRKVPFIGRVTEKILQQVCNVHTVHDLYQQRGLVQWLFKPATAEFLLKACVGCSGSSSIITSDFGMDDDNDNGGGGDAPKATEDGTDHQKGISRERTFSSESDWSQLCIRLEDIARMLFQDMTQKGVLAHTVTIKVKLTSFDVLSKGQSMKRGVYIQTPQELVDCASRLFVQIRAQYKKEHASDGSRFSIRLLGIRCSNLISEIELESTDQGTMDRFLSTAQGNENERTELRSKEQQHGSGVVALNTYARGSSGIKRSRSPTRLFGGQLEVARSATERAFDRADNNESLATSVLSPQRDLVATSEKSNEDETKFVSCPLCSRQFPANDNARLNSHIDTCLNGSTVRRAIQEDSLPTQSQSTSKKLKRLTDFWTST